MANAGGRGDFKEIAVGMKYEVTLSFGKGFKGTVMGFDTLPEPSVIIFEDGTTPSEKKNLRMVNANFITKLQFLEKQDDEKLDTEKCVVDLGALREKEALAIRKIARIGFGVIKEAQSIFDALSKTFHVEWENKDILVMKGVRIRSPYDSTCVTGGEADFVEQVKEVLKREREKLELSGTGGESRRISTKHSRRVRPHCTRSI